MTFETIQNWSRKASSWDARMITNPDAIAEAETLPIFPAGSEPMRTFTGARPQYFVAALEDGRRFLVDTQGYEYARYIAQLPAKAKPWSLEPGTIYASLDDAVRAATCLCGLDDGGATVYGTTDKAHADPMTGEAYIVSTAAIQNGGGTWAIPAAPYEPIYTLTNRRKDRK